MTDVQADISSRSVSSVHRLAIVVAGSETYGVAREIISLVKGLQALGVDVHVVSMGPGTMLDNCAAIDIPTVNCGIGEPPDFGGVRGAVRNFGHMSRSYRALANALEGLGCTNVITCMPNLVPVAGRAAHRLGIRSFWIMPNLVSNRYPLGANRIIYDLFLARYRMVPIANSHYTRTSLLNWLSPGKVAHLGIDPAEYDPAAIVPADRARFGFSPDDSVYGIFARLTPYKGQAVLIEAFAACAARYPDIRLLICGGPLDSPFGAELRQAIDAHGLSDRIILAGPQSEPAPLYAMCDVILNTRIDPEPFGLSVVEGMMMARPLLVHALGGPGEIVTDGETGWHITEPTREGFIKGIERAQADKSRWAQMGVAARTRAVENFSNVQFASRIMAIVNETAAAIDKKLELRTGR